MDAGEGARAARGVYAALDVRDQRLLVRERLHRRVLGLGRRGQLPVRPHVEAEGGPSKPGIVAERCHATA